MIANVLIYIVQLNYLTILGLENVPNVLDLAEVKKIRRSDKMKCFECNAQCHTQYIKDLTGKIVAVNKVCSVCTWESFRTKLPEKIP